MFLSKGRKRWKVGFEPFTKMYNNNDNDDDNKLIFIEGSIHCSEHLTCIKSYNSHSNPTEEVFFHEETKV